MAEHTDPVLRRQRGAWYTPAALVDVLVAEALQTWQRPDRPLTVLDPACGDGRFLAAVIEAAGSDCRVTGVDIDVDALASARQRLGDTAELVRADALAHDWSNRQFDLVIGNPPFLSQLSSLTSRGGASVFGGGVYADAAVEFLALGHRLVHPDGGRVALVLPMSVLASRDAGPVREAVVADGAIVSCWSSERSVFPDADVRTCALVIERGQGARPASPSPSPVPSPAPSPAPSPVRRLVDLPPTFMSPQMAPSAMSGDTNGWGWLIAASLGLPDALTATVTPTGPLAGSLATSGTLAARATVRADFRQQYYGLVGAVSDEGDGPPLVTSGLIDPGRCQWGSRPVRFGGQRYQAPRVHVDALDEKMSTWVRARLVPKVLVASQTRVIEAVADPDGRWLPSVPVVSVIPERADDVWRCAAVLTSPVASAWLAYRSAGTGMSAKAVRVSAPTLAHVPWPSGDLAAAVDALRAGDVAACGRAVDAAYGVPDEVRFEWWRSALPGGVG